MTKFRVVLEIEISSQDEGGNEIALDSEQTEEVASLLGDFFEDVYEIEQLNNMLTDEAYAANSVKTVKTVEVQDFNNT